MRIRFKSQPYQTAAVASVVDCFAGQPKISGRSYRMAPGSTEQTSAFDGEGFRNADIVLSEEEVLANIQEVQRRQNLSVSQSLDAFTIVNKRGERVSASASDTRNALLASRYHLDIEMETGTGKTYCYIKTIFEMNARYGWSKFIIMVPSIAIREGVYKSLETTAEHFAESYGKRARFFVYDSKRLHELESFSSDAGVNVMVINIQAFAARGADNRRIYDELDDFQSRRPIDAISCNRPILILDEPQKMQGKATTEALPKFKPLMVLRYSATHTVQYNRVHRLDALDAYNQKLVKKIAVLGIQIRGLAGTNAYLYLEGIDVSREAPVARIEMEVKQKTGEIKRRLRRLAFRDNLVARSGGLDQYRGFTVAQIDYNHDTVEFTNGVALTAGEATGDVSERDVRRIQIRETIKSHLDKEQRLFAQGVKALSLFFVDAVAKYRDYDQFDQKGEYARIFEEEYERLKNEYLSKRGTGNEAYWEYLAAIDAAKTHIGYFSIDKKTRRMKNPKVGARAVDSDDVDAYDLILKDKESLLMLPKLSDNADQRAKRSLRFIFSHSALREGWDNPNIFVMCMLRNSDSVVSRRQEVGRGLRLSVNQQGDRMDDPAVVHDINVLTVVASESYKDFVGGLQHEVAETLSSRPRRATEGYFTDKTVTADQGSLKITSAMAKQIYRYLVKNDYTDDADQITDAYHKAKAAGALADLPATLKPYADHVFQLIDSVSSAPPAVDDGRKSKTNPLNANFRKKEFQQLWERINRKAVYRVDFDTDELTEKCIGALDGELRVTRLQYHLREGRQKEQLTDEQLRCGAGFKVVEMRTEYGGSELVPIKYDLIARVASHTQLTRHTTARILGGIDAGTFGQFRQNPEHFISEASRLINAEKSSTIVERLEYSGLDERYAVDIFTAAQVGQDFSRATKKLKRHVYDYAVAESQVERDFVADLDASCEVMVYAKLPRGFLIPTPVGDYNPDWAIAFRSGGVQHLYFVAETKGTMLSLQLRGVERAKIKCAEKFFTSISRQEEGDRGRVKYGVVTSYSDLIGIMRGSLP